MKIKSTPNWIESWVQFDSDRDLVIKSVKKMIMLGPARTLVIQPILKFLTTFLLVSRHFCAQQYPERLCWRMMYTKTQMSRVILPETWQKCISLIKHLRIVCSTDSFLQKLHSMRSAMMMRLRLRWASVNCNHMTRLDSNIRRAKREALPQELAI